MRYEARVHAYDVMDQVVISVRLWDQEDLVGHHATTTLSAVTTIAGEGQDDPTEWLRDALIGALEAL